RPNPVMNSALQKLGAEVTPVCVYRWDLPADTGPLREAARQLAEGKIDVVLFTSSIQLDHLLLIAQESGIAELVIQGLKQRTVNASVGPVMTGALESNGIPVHVVPVHPKMAALVRAASDKARVLLGQYRGV